MLASPASECSDFSAGARNMAEASLLFRRSSPPNVARQTFSRCTEYNECQQWYPMDSRRQEYCSIVLIMVKGVLSPP